MSCSTATAPPPSIGDAFTSKILPGTMVVVRRSHTVRSPARLSRTPTPPDRAPSAPARVPLAPGFARRAGNQPLHRPVGPLDPPASSTATTASCSESSSASNWCRLSAAPATRPAPSRKRSQSRPQDRQNRCTSEVRDRPASAPAPSNLRQLLQGSQPALHQPTHRQSRDRSEQHQARHNRQPNAQAPPLAKSTTAATASGSTTRIIRRNDARKKLRLTPRPPGLMPARSSVSQPVSGSTHGLKIPRHLRICLNLLPDPAHVHVHRPRSDKPRIAPHRIQQVVAAEHAPGCRAR